MISANSFGIFKQAERADVELTFLAAGAAGADVGRRALGRSAPEGVGNIEGVMPNAAGLSGRNGDAHRIILRGEILHFADTFRA